MKNYFLSLALMASSLAAHNAFAADTQHAEHLVFSTGVADVLRQADSREFGIEYKSEAIFQETWDNLLPFTIHTRPMVGGYITNDNARYIFGGVAVDAPLSERWNLAMHAVVGHYSNGSNLDLGGPLSFREGIGLEYMMDSGARAGISFNHNSNAFIYDENPGTETLLINYSHPVNFLK